MLLVYLFVVIKLTWYVRGNWGEKTNLVFKGSSTPAKNKNWRNISRQVKIPKKSCTQHAWFQMTNTVTQKTHSKLILMNQGSLFQETL